MKIDMKRLENLSKIELEDKERLIFIKEMEIIIQWVEEIEKVSEENISYKLGLTPLRDDSIKESDIKRAFFLKNSPKSDDEFIIVNEVIKK